MPENHGWHGNIVEATEVEKQQVAVTYWTTVE